MRSHVVVVALALCSLPALRASAEPWDKPGYALTFHDELDGASLDGAAWGKRGSCARGATAPHFERGTVSW